MFCGSFASSCFDSGDGFKMTWGGVDVCVGRGLVKWYMHNPKIMRYQVKTVGCDSRMHDHPPSRYGKYPCDKVGEIWVFATLRNLPHMARGSLEGDMWRVLEGWLFPETKVVKKVWCFKSGGQMENKNVPNKLGFKPGKYWLLPHNPSASHSLECAWQLWT